MDNLKLSLAHFANGPSHKTHEPQVARETQASHLGDVPEAGRGLPHRGPTLPLELWNDIFELAELEPPMRAGAWLGRIQAGGLERDGFTQALADDGYWRAFSPRAAIEDCATKPLVQAYIERLAAHSSEASEAYTNSFAIKDTFRDKKLKSAAYLLYQHRGDFDIALNVCRRVPRLFDLITDKKLRAEPMLALVALKGSLKSGAQRARTPRLAPHEMLRLHQDLVALKDSRAAMITQNFLWRDWSPAPLLPPLEPTSLFEDFRRRDSLRDDHAKQWIDEAWQLLRFSRRYDALVPDSPEFVYDKGGYWYSSKHEGQAWAQFCGTATHSVRWRRSQLYDDLRERANVTDDFDLLIVLAHIHGYNQLLPKDLAPDSSITRVRDQNVQWWATWRPDLTVDELSNLAYDYTSDAWS